jgi:ATP-dependent RNA helicase DDX24/MAK5
MTSSPPLKRKAKSDGRASRKKSKIQTTSLVDSLPWKSVSHLRSVGGLEDDDDGILGLEEVDNVQVIYEDTQGGRIVKFNVSFCTLLDYYTGSLLW